ncbi:hypothetical protein AVEN_211137-1 [Araneus ventricosus]|uniref:Uncharacterized protein n=1 Tax=Araneus ventricosus TaxID=182803 RepID=A0A4Y2G2L8_ARAVE|nr:hypothetical protein AVEN_211137-1 [Araneus ventricosus]
MIRNHNQSAAATDSQALWPTHNSPHHERLMRQSPVLPGYDLSAEMGLKSHTIISIPTGEARTCLLKLQLLIRELAVTPGGVNVWKRKLSQMLLFCSNLSAIYIG